MNILLLLIIPVSYFVTAKFYLVQTDGGQRNNYNNNDNENENDNELTGKYDYKIQTGGKCRCGTELTVADRGADYIHGGNAVRIANQYPWVVLLRIKAATCGGTLIASKYILTAAHCVFNRSGTILREGAPVKLTDIKVTLGEHNRLEEGEGNLSELVVTVKKLVIHPRYDESKTLNDIALLHLTQEVDLATYTPACLPPPGVTTAYDGKMALALGWGVTEQGSTTDILREVKLKVVDEKTCNKAMADSGGPLTYKSGDQHILIGDVSFGGHWGCGAEGRYGAFGRISHFRTWIEKEMNKLEAPRYCTGGPDADSL